MDNTLILLKEKVKNNFRYFYLGMDYISKEKISKSDYQLVLTQQERTNLSGWDYENYFVKFLINLINKN